VRHDRDVSWSCWRNRGDRLLVVRICENSFWRLCRSVSNSDEGLSARLVPCESVPVLALAWNRILGLGFVETLPRLLQLSINMWYDTVRKQNFGRKEDSIGSEDGEDEAEKIKGSHLVKKMEIEIKTSRNHRLSLTNPARRCGGKGGLRA
jgi:hypothetical protein